MWDFFSRSSLFRVMAAWCTRSWICPPCELRPRLAFCCSGMSALKYGYLNVASGNVRNAVVTGSELASPGLTADHFQPVLRLLRSDLRVEEPMLSFATDFLRWMLSDGARAFLVTREPSSSLSLKIDWLDILSYAPESGVCMYYGLKKEDDGSTVNYRRVKDPVQFCKDGFKPSPGCRRIEGSYSRVDGEGHRGDQGETAAFGLKCIDWLLPHYSSDWFRQPMYDGLAAPNPGNPARALVYEPAHEGQHWLRIYLRHSGRISFFGPAPQRPADLVHGSEIARMTFAFLHPDGGLAAAQLCPPKLRSKLGTLRHTPET